MNRIYSLNKTPSLAIKETISPVFMFCMIPFAFVIAGSWSSLSIIEPWERSPPVSTATPDTCEKVGIQPASVAGAINIVVCLLRKFGSSKFGVSITQALPLTIPSVKLNP